MKLLCWDYNGTTVGIGLKGDQVRPNLVETLKDLKSEGYVSVITTTIDAKAVEAELQGFGVNGEFERYFGNMRHARRDAKEYKKVLEAMNVQVTDASGSVAIIGDRDTDHPGDLEKVVFVMNPDGQLTDARIIQSVLKDLERHGNGSLYGGFQSNIRGYIDLKEECGFIYHARIQLPQSYSGVFLSTFNGNAWPTPTVLVIPKADSAQFDILEALL